MSTTTVVTFALGMVILVIHIQHTCPLSIGACKQYGPACLGGHGKRAQNLNLMDYILRKTIHNRDRDIDISIPLEDELQKVLERSYKKKWHDWDNDSEED
ncbi:uncharacterized protein NPIL_323831 [Nephila pilipes]|uniref:Spider venom protein n=1 Tax=Nephila pilipes TaxID=299642 RepID=A0A8X6TVY2_NEPPI|nr:uncharacterized protein NPIL_323831 [Nephila pilipes]